MDIDEGRAKLTSLRMSAGNQVPLLLARIHMRLTFVYA